MLLLALCHSHIVPAKQIFNRTMEIWELKKQKHALNPQELKFKIFGERPRGGIKKVRFRGIYYGLEHKDAFFAAKDVNNVTRYHKIIAISKSGSSAEHITFKVKRLVLAPGYEEPFASKLLGIYRWDVDKFTEGILHYKIRDFLFKLCVLPIETVRMKTFVTLPMSEIALLN